MTWHTLSLAHLALLQAAPPRMIEVAAHPKERRHALA